MEIFKNKNFWLVLLIAFLIIASVSIVSELAFYVLSICFFVLLLLFFIRFPEVGIYLIAFLYPFNFFEFVYGSINVPYVDLIGLVLFIAWVIRVAYLHISKKQILSLKQFPVAIFMGLFVFASVLSLLNVDSQLFYIALKYILRPIIFFYLIYIVLPFNIINTLPKLFNVFKISFILGILLSLMGAFTFVFPPFAGLRRAIPTDIFGVYPLGVNHNSIAEILVCLIPIALILFWYEKDVFWKNIYLLGAFFMIGVNLLTLSRSGWLAILVEVLVLFLLQYRKKIKTFFTSYLPYLILVLLIPALYLMYRLATSVIATSSNLNRLKLIEISLKLFKDNPLFGSGIGTFTYHLANVQWYIIEYWDILDAHGVIFKTLSEVGLVGTISFVLLILVILYQLLKGYNKSVGTKHSWLLLGMFLVVIGGITFQLFSTSYYIAKFWFPVGLALASLNIFNLQYGKKEN